MCLHRACSAALQACSCLPRMLGCEQRGCELLRYPPGSCLKTAGRRRFDGRLMPPSSSNPSACRFSGMVCKWSQPALSLRCWAAATAACRCRCHCDTPSVVAPPPPLESICETANCRCPPNKQFVAEIRLPPAPADAQYVKNADFLEHIEQFIPSSCDDTKVLSREEQARCRMCERRTTKAACLKTLSGSWHNGSDLESCTWIDKDGLGRTVKELNFTLGANMPFQVGGSACQPCRRALP